jgi:ankyrin repeat protein
MLKQLLARPDLDVNRPRNGITPLLHAISNRQEDVAILLLKHPSLDSTSINSMDPNERTPLSYASEYGQVWLTDMLLEKGADPQLADVEGRVPRPYAAARIGTQAVTPPSQTGQAQADSGQVHAQASIFLAIDRGHLDTTTALSGNAVRKTANPGAGRRAGDSISVRARSRSKDKRQLRDDGAGYGASIRLG